MRRLGIRTAAMVAAIAGMAAPARAQPVAPLAYVQPLGVAALRAVQQRLHEFGAYNGVSDGVWGRDSQSALRRFQQSKGLQPTGDLNPSTLRMLGLNPIQVLELPIPMAVAPAMAPPVAVVAPANVGAPFGTDTVRLVQGH